jgi:hypothetical protein
LRRSLFTLAAAGIVAACGKKTTYHNPPSMNWPSLTQFEAVTKRAANQDDVSAGRAVFVLQDAGKPIGEPIDIVLPQYALHIDEEAKTKSPCILIQAEHARGQRIGGAVMLPDETLMAGTLAEFELLGEAPPQE